MADSEISRTLPAISRRKILSALAAYLAASTVTADYGARAPLSDKEGSDPAVLLWHEWKAANERFLKLSQLRWDLGSQLSREAASPEVEIHFADRRTVYASTDREIDNCLGDWPPMAGARANARARLACLCKERDAAVERLGYSSAIEAEEQASDLRLRLAKSLWATPAQSGAGAAAKLSSFIEMKTPVDHWRKGMNPALRRLEEPSWPELRSILADLVQIGRLDHG